MAYDPKNLSVLCYANGFTYWHYVTDKHNSAAVLFGGYFGGASYGDGCGLRKGDKITCNTVNGHFDVFVTDINEDAVTVKLPWSPQV